VVSISSGRTATNRIILFRFCGMPVPALCATRRGQRRTRTQESLRKLRQGRCPCSSPLSKRPRRKAWASTPSSFTSTMITNWEFIHGSFCGTGVRARNARRRGPATQALIVRKCDGPDFSGPTNSWVLTAPCDYFISIDRDSSQSSYFCREAIPAFASHRACAQNTERGPDGIRTRICYRRVTPREGIYSRFARIITVGRHNRTCACFTRGTAPVNPCKI
jgi:hypothetical protein